MTDSPAPFDRSCGTLGDRFEPFLRAVPAAAWHGRTDETDPTLTGLLHVTEDLARLGAMLTPRTPVPAVGWYVVYFDGEGRATAYAYGDDEEAARLDWRGVADEALFGEDGPDEDIRAPFSTVSSNHEPSLTATALRKPARVVEECTVRVEVSGAATWDSVVDFGLSQMGETRDGVYGFGVRTLEGASLPPTDGVGPMWLRDTSVNVYAHRD